MEITCLWPPKRVSLYRTVMVLSYYVLLTIYTLYQSTVSKLTKQNKNMDNSTCI